MAVHWSGVGAMDPPDGTQTEAATRSGPVGGGRSASSCREAPTCYSQCKHLRLTIQPRVVVILVKQLYAHTYTHRTWKVEGSMPTRTVGGAAALPC